MEIINVRLEGTSETSVRRAAAEMGLQISNVKNRGDTFHLYGSKLLASPATAAPQKVTVSVVRPRQLAGPSQRVYG